MCHIHVNCNPGVQTYILIYLLSNICTSFKKICDNDAYDLRNAFYFVLNKILSIELY